jgi:NAD(P)H-flavin reductase
VSYPARYPGEGAEDGPDIDLGGPAGAPQAAGRLLVLASATGTGPLRSVLTALPPGCVTIIYRMYGTADPGLCQDLEDAVSARGGRAYYLPSGGQVASGPLSPPHVLALIPVLRRHDACVCGPPELAGAAFAALRGAGVPAHRIAVTSP